MCKNRKGNNDHKGLDDAVLNEVVGGAVVKSSSPFSSSDDKFKGGVFSPDNEFGKKINRDITDDPNTLTVKKNQTADFNDIPNTERNIDGLKSDGEVSF